MSNLTDFFPSGGGGGLTPKFQEFISSGTFTPSQALIDAGGYIEVFLVGGGGVKADGGHGGEAIMKKMYLTSVSSVSVAIGSGGQTSDSDGSDSIFSGSSAGGSDLTALGGRSPGNTGIVFRQNGWSATTRGSADVGVFGYGAGSSSGGAEGGVNNAKVNTGQGSRNLPGGSGYCLIKWYE